MHGIGPHRGCSLMAKAPAFQAGYAGSIPVTPSMASDLRNVAQSAQRTVSELGLQLAVVMPVFNNGHYLSTRSFPSLQAAQHFDALHVLLVDDGSTDADTIAAVQELEATHPNVTAFFHETGGSGSASRPRNTAHQLVFTEYVTYLDPDDHTCDDAFWEMKEQLAATPQAQLVIGNQIRMWSYKVQEVDNIAHYAHRPLGEGLWKAGPEVLVQANFRPTSLSTYVLRAEWLRSTGITQVQGAAGQDSLFFLQLFAAAEAFTAYPKVTYVYHAEVQGSMVNTLTPSYFEKCLLRERTQVQWLHQTGLFQVHLESRFEPFFVTWYLKRFDKMARQEQPQAAAVLDEIARLYVGDPRQHRWRYLETMRFFKRWRLPSREGLKPTAARYKHKVSNLLRRLRILPPRTSGQSVTGGAGRPQ